MRRDYFKLIYTIENEDIELSIERADIEDLLAQYIIELYGVEFSFKNWTGIANFVSDIDIVDKYWEENEKFREYAEDFFEEEAREKWSDN